jgi:hypothetical protein
MEFLKNIQRSIYDPEFYRALLAKPFSYSLKYFALFSLLIALVATIYLSLSVLPKINDFLENVSPTVLNYFPDDLEVTIKGGLASTNAPEPYFLEMPFGVPEDIEMRPDVHGYEIENLLVIDTRSDESTLKEFKSYNTVILLNRKTLMYYDDNQVAIQSLAEVPDFKLDREVVFSLLAKVVPYFRLVGPLFVVFVFGGYFSYVFIGRMFYLIFAALLVWIIAKLKKINIGYQKSYQLGLHLLTASLLYQIIFGLILGISESSLLFIGLFVVLTAINLRPAKVLVETPTTT